MKLAKYLEVKKLSQDRFAKRIGCSQQLISAYCREVMVPPRKTALIIVKKTKGDVTLNDLWDMR